MISSVPGVKRKPEKRRGRGEEGFDRPFASRRRGPREVTRGLKPNSKLALPPIGARQDRQKKIRDIGGGKRGGKGNAIQSTGVI